MPTTGARGRKHEDPKTRAAGKLTEKSKSFHGKMPAPPKVELRRPKTQSDLFPSRNASASASPSPTPGSLMPRLTRVLVNVTVKGGLGPLHVLMSLESTVGELVAAAVRQYEKEGRRPFLPTADPVAFDLHYSQFSLESLDRKAELVTLGSRNFFLCPKPAAAGEASCSRQAGKASTTGIHWLRLMGFSL